MTLELNFWQSAVLLTLVAVMSSLITAVVSTTDFSSFGAEPVEVVKYVYVTQAQNFSNAYGFYNHEYFLVRTEGRSPEAIAKTTFHELAHYFVDIDYYHFCEEYYDEK